MKYPPPTGKQQLGVENEQTGWGVVGNPADTKPGKHEWSRYQKLGTT